jgi:hypothetical protein
MTKVNFLNRNLTRELRGKTLAGRRRSIVKVIVDQKESGNCRSSGRNMRVKDWDLLGSMDENRRHPSGGIPNHMLAYGLRCAGTRS